MFSKLDKTLILIVILFFSIIFTHANNCDFSQDSIYISNSAQYKHDTLFIKDSLLSSVNAIVPKNKSLLNDNLLEKPKPKPIRAAMLSAIIPGLGQAYNHKYWKIPIIYGAGAGLYYYFNKYNKSYQSSQQKLIDSYYKHPIGYKDDPASIKYRSDSDQSRKWMERDALLLGLLYLTNVVDALVDAYFYDFDFSDKLSFSPTVINMPATGLSQSSYGLAVCFQLK